MPGCSARAVSAPLTDGYVSVLLPLYLTRLGFSGLRIFSRDHDRDALTVVAVLTLVVGLIAYRFKRRHLLFSAALLHGIHRPRSVFCTLLLATLLVASRSLALLNPLPPAT